MAGGPPGTASVRTLGSRQLVALLPAEVRGRPGYRGLAQAIGTLILDGRISLRVRLPAERELAEVLAASRATVTAAYDLLREGGYARSRRGAGTWTALPEGHRPTGVHALTGEVDGEVIDLAIATMGAPDAVFEPAVAWAATRLVEFSATPGYHPYGLHELRAEIAARYTRRGLPTRADQILVTSGAQQGLTLVLGLLCRAGDRVMTENPTYANALDALRQAGLRNASIAVSQDGWDLDVAESTLRQVAPRVVYSIPDFHNPTGLLMPPEQRLRLLAATRRVGAWLVVDETMAELALDTAAPGPTAALAARGAGDHVLTLGSLSKTHWGGLRVGWIRATGKLVTELAAVRVTADMAGSVFDQLLAVALLRGMDDVLPGRLRRLREQRTALLGALERHAPAWSWRTPPGGLSLWVDLGRPVSAALAQRARGVGVRISGGNRFGVDTGTFEHRVRLPYTLPGDRLEEGVLRLARAFHDGLPLTPAQPTPSWVA
ncbi:PLP-dependent aminotransferase family protein [Streptomyces sp. NPDC006879]|uniref:MocR-like transcription factor YczR n=1 Tax=Streptomyces sp. NPDC006879 TaxID=3364767 RepID=UPI0036C1C85D